MWKLWTNRILDFLLWIGFCLMLATGFIIRYRLPPGSRGGPAARGSASGAGTATTGATSTPGWPIRCAGSSSSTSPCTGTG